MNLGDNVSSHARGERESEGREKFFPSHRAAMPLDRTLSRRSLRLPLEMESLLAC